METKVEVPVSNISAVQKELVKSDIYTAEITNVENKIANAADGSHPLYTYVTYTITKKGKYEGATVRDSLPAKASPNSKLGKLIVAAGVDLEEAAKSGTLDISSILLHRKVEVMVGKGTFKGNSGEMRPKNTIEGVPDFQ